MDNAIDELIAECGEILANPDSYNLVSEAKRIESALETVVPKTAIKRRNPVRQSWRIRVVNFKTINT